MRRVFDSDVEDEGFVSGNPVTLEHLGNGKHEVLKRFEAVARDDHFDEGLRRQSQLLGLYSSVVPEDRLRLFHLSNAFGRCRSGQTYPPTKFRRRDASIVLQLLQYKKIEAIKVFQRHSFGFLAICLQIEGTMPFIPLNMP